jgi:hypothetical protein
MQIEGGGEREELVAQLPWKLGKIRQERRISSAPEKLAQE